MQFIVYVAILVATVFSVVLEWDALVERPPAARRTIQTMVPARPVLPQVTTDTAVPVTPAAAPAGTQPPVQPAQRVAPETPAVHCNANACASAYRSFRASDCTWQPNEGPRRLCVK